MGESATRYKAAWHFASSLGWLKALPSRFKAKVILVAKSIQKLAQDDPKRIIHSLKVGLALTLVSLLYYVRPLYDGQTVSRGLNRSFATFSACALGIGAKHLASLSGEKGEPIILGILVFLLDQGQIRLWDLDIHTDVQHEFGGEYFQRCSESEEGGGGGVSKKDKPFLQECKIVLNSKNTEQSLANFARLEPPHGHFRLRHPWKQCLKVGDLARECAYKIESLNVYIGSDIRVSPEFNDTIQDVCMKMSSESGKALKALASAIKTMSDSTFSSANAYVESSKNAANDLKIALESASLNNVDIQAILSSATVASILIEVVSCVEKISEAVHELSNLAHFNKIKEAMSVSPDELNQPHNLLHTAISVEPVLDGHDSNHVVTIHETADSPEKENPNGQNPACEQPLP
ncbi:hypothetical protein Dsin_027010 [Dipteronia sinensis]|uniref:Aluminum-activated malate transporter n=1 Tax=Dipteronia sinensis TaxID=43782 RepID=A0AAD9ZYX3_9ROSI|nr:hypothetical protein Dsin_027010 [Dipteronia sinensis]